MPETYVDCIHGICWTLIGHPCRPASNWHTFDSKHDDAEKSLYHVSCCMWNEHACNPVFRRCLHFWLVIKSFLMALKGKETLAWITDLNIKDTITEDMQLKMISCDKITKSHGTQDTMDYSILLPLNLNSMVKLMQHVKYYNRRI